MYKYPVYSAAALALLFSTLFYNPARAGDTLVISTMLEAPVTTLEKTGITDLQLQEVFRRANIGLEISHLSAERALINADSGIDDGTSLRISGLNRVYPNLVMVPESFMDDEFVAISKNQEIRLDGWESLLPYSLGIIIGWKIVEENTRGAKVVTKVKDSAQLFRLLKLGRAEIIIWEKLRGSVALRKTPIEGAVILEPTLARKPQYLYLNVKHKDLIPRIVAALRASKADGTHERLRMQALQPYLATN